MLNVAFIHWRSDRFAEAAAPDRQALAILERSRGPEHPDVAIALADLAVNLAALGEHEESLATHRRVLAIRRKIYGDDNAMVAIAHFNIASVFVAQDRCAEAIEPLEAAVATWERIDPEHVEVAAPLFDLGRCYSLTGQHRRAIAPLERAIALRKAKSVDEYRIALPILALAEARHALGERSAAAALWAEARERLARSTRPDLVQWLDDALAEQARAEKP
jgi:eukaryotic-like serine/threonine-protein kinase